eukprot:5719995-Lingulodinium_polyedra.AAC.1
MLPHSSKELVHRGIEYEEVEMDEDNTMINSMTIVFPKAIRLHNEAPFVWHCSRGFIVFKKAIPGPAGERLLHGIDPIGKADYSILWKRSKLSEPPGIAYGFRNNRRREGYVCAWCYYLEVKKREHIVLFKDVKNAFSPVQHTDALTLCSGLVEPEDE